MKKLILTTLMSVAGIAAFAQGTVTFLNDTVTLSQPPDRFIRFASASTAGNPFGTNNALAVGTNYQVQLYFGASTAAESSLIPLTASPARLRGSTSTAAGTWTAGGSRTFQSASPGQTVELQVRVWDINFGSTYEVASAVNNPLNTFGKSATFLYTIPQPTDPAAAFAMANFVGFTIDSAAVPEPSSFALAGLGAAALLIFRRRK